MTSRVRAAFLVAGLVAALSGCGAFAPGDTETNREGTTENGVNWSQAGMRIDDAYVVLGSGAAAGSATLHLSLRNQDPEPDTLTGVEGDGATALTGGRLPLTLPPDETLDLDEQNQALALPLPTPRPSAGALLTVTLTFERAGSTTQALPVVASLP